MIRRLNEADYGGALRPGEGTAMAQYAAEATISPKSSMYLL